MHNDSPDICIVKLRASLSSRDGLLETLFGHSHKTNILTFYTHHQTTRPVFDMLILQPIWFVFCFETRRLMIRRSACKYQRVIAWWGLVSGHFIMSQYNFKLESDIVPLCLPINNADKGSSTWCSLEDCLERFSLDSLVLENLDDLSSSYAYFIGAAQVATLGSGSLNKSGVAISCEKTQSWTIEWHQRVHTVEMSFIFIFILLTKLHVDLCWHTSWHTSSTLLVHKSSFLALISWYTFCVNAGPLEIFL